MLFNIIYKTYSNLNVINIKVLRQLDLNLQSNLTNSPLCQKQIHFSFGIPFQFLSLTSHSGKEIN